MKELRTGIIGCGLIIKNHLKALKNVAGASCVALCDIEPQKAKQAAEEYGVPVIYQDYHEMLNNPDIDVVHICTPHYLHGKDYWGSGHGFLIDDFYRCIQTGEKFPIGGEEAIVSVKLLEAVYKSGREGCVVKL